MKNLSDDHADAACEMKELTSAVSADAHCAMTALGLAMKQEESYAYNPVYTEDRPPCQVRVAPLQNPESGPR